MFNIGFFELVILGIIGLLVVGPEQLPLVARKLARTLNDLKRAKDEIFSPVENLKHEANKFIEQARKQAEKNIGIDDNEPKGAPYAHEVIYDPKKMHNNSSDQEEGTRPYAATGKIDITGDLSEDRIDMTASHASDRIEMTDKVPNSLLKEIEDEEKMKLPQGKKS